MRRREIVARVSDALHLTQVGMAETFGVSRRTCTRWVAGHSDPTPSQLAEMARLVHAVDANLALHIVAQLGQTLESLGIVVPPAPAPPPEPAPAPRPNASPAQLTDGVVCAAAETMDVSPRAIRPALLTAFSRARDLGLSLDDVIAALTPPPPAD